ncbi:GNAT family N-acetyltransferase [Desulfosarcina cetonica]|uniref:GNAT family N-acetyltransferase n=1 Tax=Desulfosarcina cetonica TaxID=90730 RepID=UPI001C45EC3F|nr:GNAT family N-acetyltransferase [Desulfosarcina cetonica]
MVAFAHTLRTRAELERAEQVNRYLLDRPPEPVRVPHRERALEIFGDEKALDAYVRSGMFGGRVTLDDLDCFYCPEPLPFRPFSLDPRETAGKPLLVVENSNTYWSCCRANATCHRYAAVVYGQGFAACAAERASDGLTEIQHQVAAAGIRYFGDLDPTGIAIPCRINRHREERGLPPLEAERILYRALLEKNLSVPYSRSQANDHDPALARRWLGQALASPYLANTGSVRWPQEGLNFMDILDVLAVIIETSFDAESRRLMAVRRAVFVEEQGVPEALEQDEKDPFCRHALLLRDGRPVATGRLADDGHIGRIAVLSPFRGRGLGSRMIRFLEESAIANGLERVSLGAQVQAIPFYEKLGYRCYGDQFMDAGIPHRHMQKQLKGDNLAKH